MKRTERTRLIWGGSLLALFVLYTWSLTFVDVRAIGPEGSCVAYAAINGAVRDRIGVNMALYHVTDWAGVAALLVALGFAGLGLAQWIGRRSIRRVDRELLLLGAFYVLVFGAYVFFECCAINFRPVLIQGRLEASDPSSTTMLALCILPTAMVQFRRLIPGRKLAAAVNGLCGIFTGFLVVGRLLSGVHWVTDILGGALFSGAVCLLYRGVCGIAAGKTAQADR